jgi:DNA-binding CsgD family transcriptional regulator
MQRLHAKIIDQGPLTKAEAKVLRYMCEGLYTPEIALRLFRSPKTVAKHIENIAHKLNARGSSEVVLIAREMGYVQITLIDTTHYATKLILMLVMCSSLLPQHGMRRQKTPRAPVVRVVRTQRQ